MGTLALKHRRGYTHNRDVNYRQVERWRRSGLTCNKRTREPEVSIVLSATSLYYANSRRFLCSIFIPAQIFPCSMAPVLLDVSGPSLAYIVLGGFVVVVSVILRKRSIYRQGHCQCPRKGPSVELYRVDATANFALWMQEHLLCSFSPLV